ncbi:hypothetical protein J7J45_06480, partial [Candidatus Aerophobetes bacterium]|nr:hypothetical protein [Candidatus Aerophobetes bacterium]
MNRSKRINKRKLLVAFLFAGFIFFSSNFSIYAQKYRTGLIWKDPTKVPYLHRIEKIGAEKGAPVGLPSSVDNSSHLPPVKNQQLSDCVAWAFGYYYKTYQEWEEHEWDVTLPDHQFSPAFIYNQINGGVDGGSTFSDAMSLICKMGCAPLSVCPYDANCITWPTEEAYDEALPFRTDASNYLFIGSDTGIGDLKQYLSEGHIAVIGIHVWGNFDNISDYDNTYCVADKTGENRGGHAVTVVGYDDNKVTHDGIGAFKLVNSWGTGWGDNGFFWMSYEAVKSSDLCFGYAYFLTDLVGYSPIIKAKFNITHPKRGQLQIWVGLGNASSPLWEKQFFPNGLTFSNPESYPDENPFPSNNVVVDISDSSNDLNPSGDNPIFLKVVDTVAGDSGTINNYFQVEHLTWGVTATSPETPKDIPDNNDPVYVTLNLTSTEPDLTISAISFSSAALSQPVDIYVTVKNQGTQDVTDSFYVDIYYDPATEPVKGKTTERERGQIGDERKLVTQTVPAGGTIQVSFTHTFTTLGEHRIWAQVDTDDSITETNEDNNIYGPESITVEVPPGDGTTTYWAVIAGVSNYLY